MQQAIREAANRLRSAQVTGIPCAPIRDLIGADNVDAAYEVQNINTDRRLAEGRRLVGRKIGLTAKAVQKQLGVDQPDFGMLFEDMMSLESSEIRYQEVMQPRIEAEIALVLSKSLDGVRHTTDDIVRATDHIVAAFEIVGSRIANWDIKIADTIADNASSGRFVLGTLRRRPSEIDLVNCKMVIMRNGKEVSSGSGAACLGNPLNAAVWLADMMVKCGRPLQPGEVILSGALGPMVAVEPGQTFEAEFDELGRVRASFSKS